MRKNDEFAFINALTEGAKFTVTTIVLKIASVLLLLVAVLCLMAFFDFDQIRRRGWITIMLISIVTVPICVSALFLASGKKLYLVSPKYIIWFHVTFVTWASSLLALLRLYSQSSTTNHGVPAIAVHDLTTFFTVVFFIALFTASYFGILYFIVAACVPRFAQSKKNYQAIVAPEK